MLCTAPHSDLRSHYIGAHREGFCIKIPPLTRQNKRDPTVGAPALSALREDLSSRFDSPFPSDLEEELFQELPPDRHRHNNLDPLDTPLYSPSALPTPSLHFDPDSPRATSSNSPSPRLEPRILFPQTLPVINQPFQNNMAAQNPQISMPARGERAAPTFDRSKPRELVRFFEELEYLFDRAGLTQEADKKKHVLRYVDFEVEQIWKSFTEYADVNKTYKDFKEAILVHYPDASGDYVYSLRDMDLLIGERQRIGISNTVDLADYHLKFLAITTWLIEKQQLGTLEQQRGYLRAFQPRLLGAISNRLQMKKPDHHPNIPHSIKDVYEAARFILQGANTAPQNYFAPTPPDVNPPFVPDGVVSIAKREPSVKQEDLSTMFSEFTKSIVEALNQNNRNRPSSGAPSSGAAPRHPGCNACGGPHFIKECDKIEEMITKGMCKRNVEGKVVLPSGAFVPRDILPGGLLCDRIEEYHRRNPNQLAAVSLLHTIDPYSSASLKTPAITVPKPLFQLSTSDRIATIEAELYNLRSRNQKFVPLVRTRAQKARAAAVIEEVDEEEEEAADRTSKRPRIEEVEDEEDTRQVVSKKAPTVSEPIAATQAPIVPEHPYQSAKDAAYAPPANRNVGAPFKAPAIARRPDPAYKTLPPIHDPSIAVEVYKRSMEAPITITQRELLSLSPEVRSQVREVTTTRRVPNNQSTTAQNALQLDEGPDEEDIDNTSTQTIFSQPCCVHGRVPPRGSIIIPDPIERYYRSLPPGQEPDPDRLVIAKESIAVRSIYAVIDNTERKECILDPGCQIVAMSEDTCHELALVYDPAIRLNMQSANGTTDWSLGLARNVPFTIGSVTLYMQVHIIGSPAYDVLLGRPFDILTESVVRNFANEDQTITITDPNTGQRYTIPTFPRGRSISIKIAKKGFQL